MKLESMKLSGGRVSYVTMSDQGAYIDVIRLGSDHWLEKISVNLYEDVEANEKAVMEALFQAKQGD